jgi:hypothetical protein
MERMRLSLAAAAVFLALATPRAVRAQPSVGVRLAVAPAVGSTVDGLPVSDAIRLHFPLQLDALWDFGRVGAGVYASWGIARVGACAESCDASVVRAGIQVTRTFSQWRGAEPWAGLGAGYEWATESRTSAGHEVTTGWRGFELLAVQGGLDWRVARAVSVGPFLLVGGGRYSTVELDTGTSSDSTDLERKAVHAWIHVGIRGRIGLGERR